MIRKLGVALAALGAAGVLALAPTLAHAGVIPLIPVVQGQTEHGFVAGYYGADDGHTHYRYVQTVVTASPTLNNLDGVNADFPVGAVGAELCDENGNNFTGLPVAAQIGLYNNNGVYGVAFASPNDGHLNPMLDDPCIEGGLVIPNILTAHKLLQNITIHTGDRIMLGIWYNPTGHFGEHQLQFSATDLSQVNEHRSSIVLVRQQSFTEFGIGGISDAAMLTAPANNLLESFDLNKVNFYSSTKPSYPITSQVAFYGYGGLSQVQFENSSTQPVMSPNSSLVTVAGDASFNLSEGSTTP